MAISHSSIGVQFDPGLDLGQKLNFSLEAEGPHALEA
jgi:hypothetical protein